MNRWVKVCRWRFPTILCSGYAATKNTKWLTRLYTICGRLPELTEPHIAEMMLGHKLSGQWQVYDRYDYLKEQAEAYSKWWIRMMDIVNEEEIKEAI